MSIDQNMIESFFRIHYKELCIVSYQFVKNRKDAEDIVQDVFVKVINHKKKSEVNKLEPYIRAAVRNASLQKVRKANRIVSLEEKLINAIHFMQSEENLMIEREERIFINKQIEKLPPQCRKVFLLCVLDGMKYKEVAEAQNISVNTVKSQVKKAYKILRSSAIEIYLFLNIFGLQPLQK